MKRLSSLALFVVALVACSASPPPEARPYAAEIQQAQQRATSDFEKEVLADGVITEAEYDEAVRRQVACAVSRGANFKATKGLARLYTYELRANGKVSADQGDKIISECAAGNTGIIVSLYNEITANPRKENREELLLACLKRHKIVDGSYSLEQLRVDRENPQGSPVFASEGASACVNNPMIEP